MYIHLNLNPNEAFRQGKCNNIWVMFFKLNMALGLSKKYLKWHTVKHNPK